MNKKNPSIKIYKIIATFSNMAFIGIGLFSGLLFSFILSRSVSGILNLDSNSENSYSFTELGFLVFVTICILTVLCLNKLFQLFYFRNYPELDQEIKLKKQQEKNKRTYGQWKARGLFISFASVFIGIILALIIVDVLKLYTISSDNVKESNIYGTFTLLFFIFVNPIIVYKAYMRIVINKYMANKQEERKSQKENTKKEQEEQTYQWKKESENNQKTHHQQSEDHKSEDKRYYNKKSVEAPEHDYFAGCTNIEQIKKRHRDLARTYHPDGGSGDEKTMKEINLQYEKLKEKFNIK